MVPKYLHVSLTTEVTTERPTFYAVADLDAGEVVSPLTSQASATSSLTLLREAGERRASALCLVAVDLGGREPVVVYLAA